MCRTSAVAATLRWRGPFSSATCPRMKAACQASHTLMCIVTLSRPEPTISAQPFRATVQHALQSGIGGWLQQPTGGVIAIACRAVHPLTDDLSDESVWAYAFLSPHA